LLNGLSQPCVTEAGFTHVLIGSGLQGGHYLTLIATANDDDWREAWQRAELPDPVDDITPATGMAQQDDIIARAGKCLGQAPRQLGVIFTDDRFGPADGNVMRKQPTVVGMVVDN
jgi:hypothetical protein